MESLLTPLLAVWSGQPVGPLYGVEVNDAVATIFGTGTAAAVIYAIWRGIVAIIGKRGDTAVAASDAENRREELLQKGDARTFGEMQILVQHQQQWINDRDARIEELTAEVAECKADRARLEMRVQWLESLSPPHKPPTPPAPRTKSDPPARTKSDQIKKPKPEGE